MMKIQHIFFACIILMGTSSSYAYDVFELTEKLNLSESQETRLIALNRALNKRMMAIESSGRYTPARKKQKIKDLLQEHKSDVSAFMSPKQLIGFEATLVLKYPEYQ